jgi:hypothetical protein
MNEFLRASLLGGLLLTCSAAVVAAEEKGDDLGKRVTAAKVTLQQGLTASEAKGKPISGKFEIDEGHFQLSTYTLQGGKFYEVIVDHLTGAISKSEQITEGEDLAEAKKQSAAMAKATKPLKSAVDQAEQGSLGFRAVSVEPQVKAGHPVATVELMKGAAKKSVSEPLD